MHLRDVTSGRARVRALRAVDDVGDSLLVPPLPLRRARRRRRRARRQTSPHALREPQRENATARLLRRVPLRYGMT